MHTRQVGASKIYVLILSEDVSKSHINGKEIDNNNENGQQSEPQLPQIMLAKYPAQIADIYYANSQMTGSKTSNYQSIKEKSIVIFL